MADLTDILDRIQAEAGTPYKPELDLARWIEAITRSHANVPRLVAALRYAAIVLAGQPKGDVARQMMASILEGRDG